MGIDIVVAVDTGLGAIVLVLVGIAVMLGRISLLLLIVIFKVLLVIGISLKESGTHPVLTSAALR
jgi:hypothetical protein